MKVQIVLCLVREATGSKLMIEFCETLTNEQVDQIMKEQYKGWELDEIIIR